MWFSEAITYYYRYFCVFLCILESDSYLSKCISLYLSVDAITCKVNYDILCNTFKRILFAQISIIVKIILSVFENYRQVCLE